MSLTVVSPINGADTAWMLVSTALVLLMTPALGFFYRIRTGEEDQSAVTPLFPTREEA